MELPGQALRFQVVSIIRKKIYIYIFFFVKAFFQGVVDSREHLLTCGYSKLPTVLSEEYSHQTINGKFLGDLDYYAAKKNITNH